VINIRCVGQRWFKTALRQMPPHARRTRQHAEPDQAAAQASKMIERNTELLRYGQCRSSHRKLRHDQPDKLDCG
jgi:hypothetical protein